MGRSGAKNTKVQKTSRKVSPTSAPPPAPSFFTGPFFANVLSDDLTALPKQAPQYLASSMWQLAQQRKRGAPNVRVFNPTLEKDGWAIDHSVLEIAGDDMPFLVDSVTGELRRRGYAIHMAIHPVLFVRRDASGKLIDLKGGKAEAESLMHIQFDRCPDQPVLDDIAKTMRAVLGEVRASVEDWPKMRQRAAAVLAEISSSGGAKKQASEIEEAKAFLNWLSEKNFTYLGYRKLDLVRQGDNVRWKIEPNASLGILRDEKARVFGNLLNLATQPPTVLRFLEQKGIIIVIKTDERARVHRTVPMDAVLVRRFDEDGRIIGEHLFVGLFTSSVYTQSARNVPFLRRKIAATLARASFDPDSHDGRTLLHVLNTYPRDELFQIDESELTHNSLSILRLQEHARVALFLRYDPFGRFATCLIYVPRERYNSEVLRKIKRRIETAFEGRITDQNIRIDDSPLARLFMTVAIGPASRKPYRDALESDLREICRFWPDMLKDSLMDAYGEAKTLSLLRRYGEAFPPAYSDVTPIAAATRDIESLEKARKENAFIVDLSEPDEEGLFHLKLSRPESALVLSNVLPLVENMGLKARYMGGPYEVIPAGSDKKIFIHEFVCRPGQKSLAAFAQIKPLFEEAFAKIWSNEIENDVFNALTLYAGLPWREIMVLRTLARYLRQLRVPYSTNIIAATLLAHPQAARNLADLFLMRHDPDLRGDRTKLMAALADKISAAANEAQAVEEDHILRRFLNLIQSSLRTNYFQRTPGGLPKPYLSIKLDSHAIDYMPLPKPLIEVFVYSPRVEAVHLRGGKVARGGIRWSDRREDFRNEVLGLMKAQMVKNSVIVPVGSKGGFIVKQPPQDPEKLQAEGIACYRILMCGLLDITDNREGLKIVPPERVVRHDDDDPYLVVAADKGTASFSDIANSIAQDYKFWLDDAFASGGSAGYDHKQMGITSRGVWEAVKRHFREMGRDIQTTPFTCIGIGDMSGDVFGNGMLQSKHTRLIGAFDHRHIFCDPDPDAAVSYAERQRMFKLPRSSWADYDRKKISKGGGIFARTEKNIKLTPEIKKAYGIAADSVSPVELIQAMLRCKVDLLFFGGIGTYVKATDETHEAVADRANDSLRIDGCEIQASVIGEGANLGMTQRGRIEYAMKGGRLNTDAIDNSAGVATSDREVNIKILLRKAVTSGALSLEARNKLLASMTNEVAHLMIRDNYRQTQAISVAQAHAAELLPLHARSVRLLEKNGMLNRAVEFLPDETEIAERQRVGKGLTRPELAVLLSYAKIWLYDQLLASDFLDDNFLHDDLMYYFPAVLRTKYEREIEQHQLRREIIATRLANSLTNRVGSHFVFTVAEQTGKDAASVARTYHLVRAAFGLHALWKEIESLDNRVPAKTQIDMFQTINRMMSYVVPWLLTREEMPAKLASSIEHYRDGVERLAAWFTQSPQHINGRSRKDEETMIQQGVPVALASRIALMPYLTAAPDIVRLAEQAGCSIEQAAAIFYGLGHRLDLDWLREHAAMIGSIDNHLHREARTALLDDLFISQRALATAVLGHKKKGSGKKSDCSDLLGLWIEKNAAKLERYDALISELRAAGAFDLAMLTLASRHLSALVG
jgi:glutamate dehydrogenase